ncbi:uncharacterized protein LOC129741325 [Uranotaenia lowii]|uniref:uncharacterized protein LOC129741325 n=1 Tax=Uranotaenia lowii TaxID=190385 RepID=UPI0024788F25|nr:uncharacterized protein LOC129741325 [Uranotaenia lowii]
MEKQKSRVVPASSTSQNVLSTALGLPGNEAWSENERLEHPKPDDGKTPLSEDPSEPFLRKESESESSVENELLCCPPVSGKPKIYSIDLEKGQPDKRTSSASESSSHRKSKPRSPSKKSVGGKAKSQCDAKVVDKFVRNNRKRRKRKDAKAVLVKLCQCCPWTAPWSLLIVSAIQV